VKEHPLATATKQQNGSSIATQQIDPLVLKGEGLGEIQKFGTVLDARIALDEKVRIDNSAALNGVLANTMILQSLYKKYHWLMRGITFYQLHLLLDKHSTEQLELIDALAERVQKLGGVSVGDHRHAAELTDIPRPPNGVQSVPAMLEALLQAHELTITRIREAVDHANENGDEGTSDVLVSEVLRTNETQVWFVSEHLVLTPVVEA